MSAIQVFKNSTGFTVRSFEDDDGIWFVAKDVAQALDYSDASNAARLFQSVPDIWKGVKRIHTRSENGVEQDREFLCLTEQGLYFFLGRSDKPKALPYQMWIAGDVVPSIRKTGAYALKTPELTSGIMESARIIFTEAGLKDNQLVIAFYREIY